MSGVSSKGIKIEELRARIRAATSSEMKRVMSDALGMTAEKLTLNEFRSSQGPTGEPWASVKRKGKPLIDTGNLRASLATTANEGGFLIGVRASYAPCQQFGTKPRQVAARVARTNARGRFVSVNPRQVARKAFEGTETRGGFLVRIKEHTHPGIRPRPILPQGSADLVPVWMPKLEKTAKQAVRIRLKGGE